MLNDADYMTPYIRALAIHGEDRRQGASVFPHDGEWLRLLARMPRLAHLRLEGFRFHIPGGLRLSLSSWFSGIQSLGLKSMNADGDSLASLIRAARSLSTLIIHSTPALMDVPLVPSLPIANPLRSVNTLIWNPGSAAGSALPTMSRWVGKTELPIRRLSIASIGLASSPLSVVQQLLDASVQSLEDLHLEFAFTTDTDTDIADHIDLRRNARLRTVHVAYPIELTPSLLLILIRIQPERYCPGLTAINIRMLLSQTLGVEHPMLTARRMSATRTVWNTFLHIRPELRVRACMDATHIFSEADPALDFAGLGAMVGRQEHRKATLDYAQKTMAAWRKPLAEYYGSAWQRIQFVTYWGPHYRGGPIVDHIVSSEDYKRGDKVPKPKWYHRAQAPWDYLWES